MSQNKEQYFLVFDIQYTLLEKYIYQTIKKSPDGGFSDKKIAKILILKPEEVKYIIEDELLSQFIQGDSSRRTISKDFTELEWNIVEKSKDNKKKNEFNEISPKPQILTKEKKEALRDTRKYKKIENKQIPDNLKKFKAKEYYQVLESYN